MSKNHVSFVKSIKNNILMFYLHIDLENELRQVQGKILLLECSIHNLRKKNHELKTICEVRYLYSTVCMFLVYENVWITETSC